MNKHEFFKLLYELNGISKIDEEMVDILNTFQKGIKEETLIVFAMYFSLIGDGNVCMCLDPETLKGKWTEKWSGLLAAADLDDNQYKYDFSDILNTGTAQIRSELGSIIARVDKNEPQENKLFVIKTYENKEWLFTSKYFNAVKNVSEKLAGMFKPVVINDLELEIEKTDIINYFYSKSGITLNAKQAEAIVRGQNENLFISGGPGYGKTTVVCYLLWKLLENVKDIPPKYNIYLAAPSGKAQDRLKESINEQLEKLGTVNADIFKKLTNAPSFTIHRLLSYNPKDNKFRYNKDHQFDKESIFVIDEASMIDICLFQKLLEAIPEGARLFILGDPYQLPSVQAGAVLGDILDNSNEMIKNIVELDHSNRFKAGSVLGDLAQTIKKQEEKHFNFKNWDTFQDDFKLSNSTETYPVDFICLDTDNKIRTPQINDIADKWSRKFCNYSEHCILDENVSEGQLNELFNKVNSARILCAERRGKVGVETLNKLVSERVRPSKEEEYYPGLQLIITQNQAKLDLYNGDCGVVVSFIEHESKYLMLKKPTSSKRVDSLTEDDNIKRKGDFVFYPIHVLPKESVEMAFAITIHKSQGSGYKNIMVFIPEKEEHPLLNNQIIYTAVTRSQGCTYIVGSNETMYKAIQTKIKRDTKILV